ncbi:acetyl-CoA acetyltransferase [Williamsia sp. D3]|uniref:acetyl-CoA acetyltransferase n=1 Tax=Williamsia sp. D3 TaxID=1313067 RepID=UPI0003D354D1|nr:acetyl-CoA acetyltransferase [Williamsia sp. D3]ETD31360.1 acetyl-CoA acetyltransferase [Williamsia sp. D3]
MAIDPTTPVLIGYGQVNQRDDASPLLEPVDLIAAAARAGTSESVLQAVDSIRLVRMLSWRYRDPGLLLGQRLGAEPTTTEYIGDGGNGPQTLLNRACMDITAGKSNVVLIGGAETWRTRMRLKRQGQRPDWTRQPDELPKAQNTVGSVPMNGPAEDQSGLDRPAHVYPLFEQAIRLASGRTSAQHSHAIAELWSTFNAVAVDNHHAWVRTPFTAEAIATPSPDNRLICDPYTKLMNSNNSVEQAAALILTSVATARSLGVSQDNWIFPVAGTDAHDTYAISERHRLDRSPAIRIGGRRVLELAGVGIDDVDFVDVYSCFPSAVQIAAAELGLPIDAPDRPLTVTGGLSFAGGPWNNYVSHSIATMAERLRENPGSSGLVTANGGYLTKHAFGVYSSTPPTDGFRWEDVQSDVNRHPTVVADHTWVGNATIESWTVAYDRDGAAKTGLLAVRTPTGARTLAAIHDADQVRHLLSSEPAGTSVEISEGRTATLN